MALHDLRGKLKAMSSSPAPPAKPARLGLKKLTHYEPLCEGLHALNSDALRRIGHQGEWPGIERILFLDTETTGLSGGAGTVAFLVGLGFVEHGKFVVEQYMMRDYADEPELILAIAERMQRFCAVVTFNGKTFDMPLLRSRFTMCRMQAMWRDLDQLDLLHPSRRLWKRRLGNCKLSNIEAEVLRRGREGDLPGSEVPQRFFDYLKTGDESLLDDVLQHNRLDIVSLGALLVTLCEAYAEPSGQLDMTDLYSMGRTMQKLGEHEEALKCYQLAAMPRSITSVAALRGTRYAGEANMAMSLMFKRRGEYKRAEQIWLDMVARGQLAERPMIELAKLYEHRWRETKRALEMTERALETASDRYVTESLQHRRERLMKMEKKKV